MTGDYTITIPATVTVEISVEDDDYASISHINVDVARGRKDAHVETHHGYVFGPTRAKVLEAAYHYDIPWPIPHYEVQPS